MTIAEDDRVHILPVEGLAFSIVTGKSDVVVVVAAAILDALYLAHFGPAVFLSLY